MSKKKPKIEIPLYFMSMHIGVVLGPVDAFFKIEADKKEMWSGTVDSNQTVTVDKQELFGGVRKEGGVAGDVHFYLGGPTQTMSAFITGKLNRTTTTSPFFRGLASIFLTEAPSLEIGSIPGMYLRSNSPNIPEIAVKVARYSDDWYPAKAIIGAPAGAPNLLEIQTFANQTQMTNEYDGTTGSTTDYWEGEYGGFVDYNTGQRWAFRQNYRLFQSLTPPIPDAIHSASSSEQEDWSDAIRIGYMPTNGSMRLNEPTDPGYLFGFPIEWSVWRSGDADVFYQTIDEFNYNEHRITRFTRVDQYSNWIADDHTNASNFYRAAEIHTYGFDDSGDLYCYYDTGPADYFQIRSKTPPFALLNTGPNGWDVSTINAPNVWPSGSFACRTPGNLLTFAWRVNDTSYSTIYSQSNELLVYTLNLSTGSVTFRNSGLWSSSNGPFGLANVLASGTFSPLKEAAHFYFVTYDRDQDRIIFVFRVPGEFWVATTFEYYEYAWASVAGDWSDYQWHGYFPWSGLRKSDGTRAASTGEADYVYARVQWGFEAQRQQSLDSIGGAEFMKIPALAWYKKVTAGPALTDPTGLSVTSGTDCVVAMAVDLANGGVIAAEFSDVDDFGSLPQRTDTGSDLPVADLLTVPDNNQNAAYADFEFGWHYDPICKVWSGISERFYSNWYVTNNEKDAANRFGSNSPLPPLAFRVSEITPWAHLTLETTPLTCACSNPAHIIYEVLTNTEFGMGVPASSIDDAAFRQAADLLHDENLGLCMMWVQQSTGEQFIQEVIDHIEAVLYVDPHTGLLVLKLIRGGYDTSTLRKLNRSNARLSNYRRKGLGETINQLTVTWTNPENEEEETVTLQEPGNIAQQGNIVNDDRNYYGVRSSDLALQLARRDLRVGSYPLATMEASLSNEFWDIVPGEVLLLDWTFRNGDVITDMAVRITEVERDHKGAGKIDVKMTEDIFALDVAQFTTLPGGEDLSPGQEPAELEFIQFFSLPYYFGVNLISPDVTFDEAAEETFFGILGATTQTDVSQYTVLGQETDSLGGTAYADFGFNDIIARSVLDVALVEEISTTLAGGFPSPTTGPSAIAGTFVIIGNDPEEDQEIAIVDAVTPNITLKRGMLDTTPRAWPIGTPVWLVPPTADIVDDEPYAAPQSGIKYKLLTITSLGTLSQAAATEQNVGIEPRHYLPLRPANVQIEAAGFGTVDLRSVTPNASVTWARRNRLTEDSVVNFWDDADVTPEASQTVTIEALNLAKDTVLGSATGLTGTSHNFPVSNWGSEIEGYVRVYSVRGGDDSWQAHDIHVLLNGLVGSGAITAPVVVLNGIAGAGDVVGFGNPVTPVPTLSGTGEVVKTGSGAITAPVVVLNGTGFIGVVGNGAILTTVPTLSGQANQIMNASGAISTPVVTLNGTGTTTFRLTEAGDFRITEAGDFRITEE